MGAFHYAKDSGDFGRNSNGKVRFGFFRTEYSGSPHRLAFVCNGEKPLRDYYDQIDGVAMGSPLGPVLSEHFHV